jgi:hypothetical protein
MRSMQHKDTVLDARGKHDQPRIRSHRSRERATSPCVGLRDVSGCTEAERRESGSTPGPHPFWIPWRPTLEDGYRPGVDVELDANIGASVRPDLLVFLCTHRWIRARSLSGKDVDRVAVT